MLSFLRMVLLAAGATFLVIRAQSLLPDHQGAVEKARDRRGNRTVNLLMKSPWHAVVRRRLRVQRALCETSIG